MGNVPKPRVSGNIDLSSIKPVRNMDGSYSTVRSISIGTDSGEVLIPTVIDGKVVPDSTAIRMFKQTGKHLGIFNTPDEANAFAEDLHRREAKRIAKPVRQTRVR